MAIVKVKIAQVSQWCSGAKKLANKAIRCRAGQLVEIETNSMWIGIDADTGEQFRNWNLVGSDLLWLRMNTDGESNSLCEHMLEMD